MNWQQPRTGALATTSAEQKDMNRCRRGRAEAMREAHETAAYNQWLAVEIQEASGVSKEKTLRMAWEPREIRLPLAGHA